MAIAATLAVTFPWGSEVFGCVWAKQWQQGHVICKWFATSPKNTAFPHWPCFPAASVLVLQCSAFVNLFPVFWESWAHCPILPKFPIQKHPNFHFFWVPLSSNAMSSSPTHHTWWSLRVPRALLRHDVQVHLSKSRHQRHSKTIKHIQKHKKKTLFHSRTICVSKYVSRSNKIFCATREPIIHPIAFMVWRKSSCPQVVTTSA